MKKLSLFVIAFVILVLTFCVLRTNAAKAEKVENIPTKAKANASVPNVPPTGEALWDYLEKQDYAKNWKIWPGMTAFHSGEEPHGLLLTTHVNPVTLQAIKARTGILPDGSIIVTQNYNLKKRLESLTVMYKVKGYNPGENDWFWAKYGPKGTVAAAGRLDLCQDCHYKKRANDYIWTVNLR